MKLNLTCVFLANFYFLSLSLGADESLKNTQKLLNDPKARQEVIKKDAKAKEIDDQVKALAGSDSNAEEIYGLSSEIMENLVKETGGDPVKMQKLIEEAGKDPETFAKRFSKEQQAKLKAISKKVPGGKERSKTVP
jgi:hypothetical protein